MRRSNTLLKIITAIVFLALVVYVGYSLYDSATNSFRTVAVNLVHVGDSCQTSGIMVREEQIVSGSGGFEFVTVSEGEKLGKNQTLSIRYASSVAIESATKLRTLELQKEQLENILNGSTSENFALTSVLGLSSTVNSGSIGHLAENLAGINTYVFSGGYDSDSLQQQLNQVNQEIAGISSFRSSGGGETKAPVSGIFSYSIDGYESITPGTIFNLTPSQLKDATSTPNEASDSALGKLITGNYWYYATTMSQEDAAKLTVRKKATVTFNRTYGETISMLVESISEPEDGQVSVVFSSNRYLSDLTQIRFLYASVLFDTTDGYLIPLEALHMDEGGKYIYIVAGLQAEKVYVSLDGETDSGYLINSPEEGKLYNGVEVIKSGNDLFDGKVIG